MILTYENKVRSESDQSTIELLLRKGWMENKPPSHDPITQHEPMWNGTSWIIVDKTAEEIAASRRKVWTQKQFRDLFTNAELIAFLTASQNNPAFDLMRLKITTLDRIESDNTELVAGLQAMVQAGIITEEKRKTILE